MRKVTTVYAGDRQPFLMTLKELWDYRLLLWVFAVRDLKVRYTQTVLGLGWVLITPLITVGVFTFVFGVMIKIPSDGLPYLMFYLVAIVPWYAFIKAVAQTIGSIEGNIGLITKVYFPRMLLGASYGVSASLDYLVGFCLINFCAMLYGLWTIKLTIMMPVLLYIQLALALGIGLLFAPLNTKYRDVSQMVPLGIQLFYFGNPILYPVSSAPEWIRPWFIANPFSVVISTYRRCLRDEWPEWSHLALAVFISTAFLALGAYYFNTKDRDLVDSL